MDYEAILIKVYGNGAYQLTLLFFCALTTFVSAFEMQSLIFLHVKPAFNCSDPALKNYTNVTWLSKADYTLLSSMNFTNIPPDMEPTSAQCWAGARSVENPDIIQAFDCGKWDFEKVPMESSLVTDFSLVCDNAPLDSWLQSVVILSIAAGHAAAIFTDRLSRRKLLIFYCIWEITFMIAVPLVSISMPLVFIVRILRMVSCSLAYLCPCILQELLPTKKRAIFANIYWLPFGIGYMSTAGIAYLTRNWYVFRLYGLIPLVVYFPLMYLIPETPRWVMVHGKREEFISIIRRIAKWNNANQPESFYDEIRESMELDSHLEALNLEGGAVTFEKEENEDTLCDIFRNQNMRLKTIVLCLVHSTITLCYFGLTTSANFTDENVFLNVLYQGMSEMPSSVLAWTMSDYMGRRPSLIFLLSLTGVSICTAPAIKPLQSIVSTIVAIVGRIAVTTTFCISDLYATEVYPTTVRNMGIYLVVTIGGVVGAVAPQVNLLHETAFYLPGLIYGSLCGMGAVLIYFYLPETKFCPMAQTIRESEQLARGGEKRWARRMSTMVDIK